MVHQTYVESIRRVVGFSLYNNNDRDVPGVSNSLNGCSSVQLIYRLNPKVWS